jgi:hypothetical protein
MKKLFRLRCVSIRKEETVWKEPFGNTTKIIWIKLFWIRIPTLRFKIGKYRYIGD